MSNNKQSYSKRLLLVDTDGDQELIIDFNGYMPRSIAVFIDVDAMSTFDIDVSIDGITWRNKNTEAFGGVGGSLSTVQDNAHRYLRVTRVSGTAINGTIELSG